MRVNSGRVDATYRLQEGDRVRIPPMRLPGSRAAAKPRARPIDLPVLFEDEALLVVNKPAGLAVHGGSGISFGVIEHARGASGPEIPRTGASARPRHLGTAAAGEEALGADRDARGPARGAGATSAIWPWSRGNSARGERNVELPLQQIPDRGRRAARQRGPGRARSRTPCSDRKRACGDFTLLSAELHTGRTHQIRVHLAHLGFPIVGDDKYGDFELNRELAKQGLKRMFLHAAELAFVHPVDRRRGWRCARRCRRNWRVHPRAGAQGDDAADADAMSKRFELLVFDWDGTLMDSAGAIVAEHPGEPAAISGCRCPTTSAPPM